MYRNAAQVVHFPELSRSFPDWDVPTFPQLTSHSRDPCLGAPFTTFQNLFGFHMFFPNVLIVLLGLIQGLVTQHRCRVPSGSSWLWRFVSLSSVLFLMIFRVLRGTDEGFCRRFLNLCLMFFSQTAGGQEVEEDRQEARLASQPVNTSYTAMLPPCLADQPAGPALPVQSPQMPLRRFSLLWKIQLWFLLV